MNFKLCKVGRNNGSVYVYKGGKIYDFSFQCVAWLGVGILEGETGADKGGGQRVEGMKLKLWSENNEMISGKKSELWLRQCVVDMKIKDKIIEEENTQEAKFGRKCFKDSEIINMFIKFCTSLKRDVLKTFRFQFWLYLQFIQYIHS